MLSIQGVPLVEYPLRTIAQAVAKMKKHCVFTMEKRDGQTFVRLAYTAPDTAA